MSSKFSVPALIAVLSCSILCVMESSQIARATEKSQFYCGTFDGIPTTIFLNARTGQKIPLIQWTRSLGGYEPSERCEMVSQNLQNNFRRNRLRFMGPARNTDPSVICAFRSPPRKLEYCPSEGVLMSLRDEDNPQAMTIRIGKAMEQGTYDPLQHSQSILYTESGSDVTVIDLEVAVLNIKPVPEE